MAGDRYEPLPSVAQLPAWIWRRLPPAGRVLVALVPVAALALALLLGPGIERSKDERARAQERRLARVRAERVERLLAEQRPRFARSAAPAAPAAPAGERLAARRRTVDEAARTVLLDARRRVRGGALRGPIRRVECEPFPRTVEPTGAERDLSRRSGRYACLAVTAEAPTTSAQQGSIIGHPYRLRVDFESGRYALCKVTGRPAEGSLEARPAVTVPRACGGR